METLTNTEDTEDSGKRNAWLVEFLREHAVGLRALFVRDCGQGAEDAFQQFVQTVLIERELWRRLDQANHGTWPLLRKAVRDFCIDWRRQDGALKRRSKQQQPRSQAAVESLSSTWARALLSEAVKRTAAHFKRTGLEDHWVAFSARVLGPVSSGGSVPPVSETLAKTSFTSRDQVYNALSYVRRRIRYELEGLMLESARDGSIDVAELWAEFLESIRA